MEPEIFTLRDGDVTVNVKPCRRCFEIFHNTVKPVFQVFRDAQNDMTVYRVRCPECYRRPRTYSDMWSENAPGEVEKRYNDWGQPFEAWARDLDW